MNISQPIFVRPKVAVIGAGISGLASAYRLSENCDVTIFEAEPRFGGHARTLYAGRSGKQAVDTGFIVFNYANYPHLTRMFRDLDVPVEKSNMSFGASIANGKIEYALRDLNGLFAQRRNLVRPQMYRMIKDILKFGKNAEALAQDETMSTGELLDRLNLGDWFVNYYLLPICGAIWSTPPSQIRDFPAYALVSFFRNHALLEAGAQHQWWTVSGGSIEYVKRLTAGLEANGVLLENSMPVKAVERDALGAKLFFESHEAQRFDHVIFACHSDEALSILNDPTDAESQALSAIRYQDNLCVLHADERQMPHNRNCWSAWVYQSDGRGDEAKIGVTYWMNRLQNIDENDPLFVTLNASQPIQSDLIYDEKLFRHPIFDAPALKAQKSVQSIQGENQTWYAGAYLRHGFHEDGFASAVRVADGIQARLTMQVADAV